MGFAYLDGGTASMITAAVVGGAAGMAVAARSAMDRVKGVFSRGKGSESESDQVDDIAAEPATVE
jgi:hypothetical protein